MRSQADLAWAAGFFDGEGSVCITKHTTTMSGRQYTQLALAVSVVNTHEASIRLLQVWFGGQVYRRTMNHLGKRLIWCWKIQSQQALRFLEAIKPYLKVKATHAIYAIAFQHSKRFSSATTKRRDCVPAHVVQHREVIRSCIRALNNGTYGQLQSPAQN